MSSPQRSTERGSHPDRLEGWARGGQTAARGPAAAVDGLILLTGVYVAISPWVVHFSGTNPYLTVENLIVGLAIALMGFGLRLAPERMHRLSWTLAPIGAWLILSPSTVTASHDVSAGIVWNNGWTGGITCLLGLVAAHMTPLGP